MAKKTTSKGKGSTSKGAKGSKTKAVPIPTTVPSASSIAFADLVRTFGFLGPDHAPLVDICFFLGAGFSKAWDTNYPTGAELFKVTGRERLKDVTNIELAANFSNAPPLADLTLDHIRQLVYSLDMYSKYTDIRPRYADDNSLRHATEKLRTFFGLRLQQLAGRQWRWFRDADRKFTCPAVFTSDQNHIRSLFNRMFTLIDGSQGHLQGARFNFITTNYDWLPELIIDSVCGDDDSAFNYLYRGVTPDHICGHQEEDSAFTHSLVFNLLKLNGGLEIFRKDGRYHFDYRKRTRDDYRVDPPVLMLPSREQNYQDDYFLSIFPKAVRLLQESTVLILVGYSLPEDDALLRFIIRHFCEDEADSHRKVLFYVDMCSEKEQISRLQSVFPFAGTPLEVYTYAGGFASWSAEVVSLL